MTVLRNTSVYMFTFEVPFADRDTVLDLSIRACYAPLSGAGVNANGVFLRFRVASNDEAAAEICSDVIEAFAMHRPALFALIKKPVLVTGLGVNRREVPLPGLDYLF